MDFGRFDPPPAPGTLGYIGTHLEIVIERERPVHATREAIRREIALWWLRNDRPFGVWAKARWIFGIARMLLR